MRTTLLLCVGVGLVGALSSCVIGAPPGFSSGDAWTLPLVDPLSDGRLVTPVMVNGKGPFLFAIDPDARQTTADVALAGIAGINAVEGGPDRRLSDESDHTRPTFYADLPNLKIGSLNIDLVSFALVENNHFNAEGRRIWGVLGKDVIADSLVFTVDRDRGIATLTVNKKFVPPAGAQVIAYNKFTPRRDSGTGMTATPRYLVKADVDGKQVDLHLDLGELPSELLATDWDAGKLAVSDWTMTLIDEAGTSRTIAQEGTAAQVSVMTTAGPLARPSVGFVPFEDHRFVSGQIDGTLGLNFFRPYVVSADWQNEKFYLTPRDRSPATAAARIGRWNSASTARCAAQGCATATATLAAPPPGAEMGMADGAGAPGAASPSAPKATFHIARDPALTGQNLEVVLAATGASGEALPQVYVDLGANTLTLDAPIDARFANARFEVADISPFPRACPNHAPSCAHVAPPLVP